MQAKIIENIKRRYTTFPDQKLDFKTEVKIHVRSK